jgi:hypothetical protein
MQSTTLAAVKRRRLSRHQRQRQARTEAFSRRTTAAPIEAPSVRLPGDNLELIHRLVRLDCTALSTALLATAGIGAGDAKRLSVLVRVSEAARSAPNERAISELRWGRSPVMSSMRFTAMGGLRCLTPSTLSRMGSRRFDVDVG